MSDGFFKRVLRPDSTASRLARRLGRKVAPALPEGLRWRLGLPIQMTNEIAELLSRCENEIGAETADWHEVLAVAERHSSDRLADILRSLGDRDVTRMNELKLLTSFMTLQGTNMAAQDRYRALLQRFDPALTLPDGLQGEGFSGRGVGSGSLNAYRRVRLDDTVLFEKIYLSEHWEIEHMLYAQSHILPRLGELRSPKLEHLVQGRRLSAAYFRWADIPLRQPRTLRTAITLVQQLQRIDAAELPPPPSSMTDFSVGQLDALLRSVPESLAQMFPQHSPPLAEALPRWRQRIEELPKGFSHGDPSIGNVLPGGWVLDWDNCGLFPLGHDAAHYLALRHEQASWDRIRYLFDTHFTDPRAPEASWEGFLYFFVHFLTKMPRRHDSLFPSAVAELTRVMEK